MKQYDNEAPILFKKKKKGFIGKGVEENKQKKPIKHRYI